MKMTTIKMKNELMKRLSNDNRTFEYNREKETLRIEDKHSGKGLTIELPGIVSKYEVNGEKAIAEKRIVQYT